VVTERYHVEDRSIMVPFVKRFVWQPVLQLIPPGFAANDLTLLGTACSVTAFLIAVFVEPSRWSMGLIAVLVFSYLTFDNIDGAQARRTGTSTPLGEFLDHWLDAFNLTFLFLGAVIYFGLSPERGVLIMVVACLSYGMTFWEQQVTGQVYMGPVGNVEGIVITNLFYVAGAILGPEVLCTRPVLAGYDAIDGLFVAALAACLGTILGPILRVRRRLFEPVLIFAPVLFVGGLFFLVPGLESRPVEFLLALLTPTLAGRVLIGHLLKKKAQPDLALLIGIPFASVGLYLLEASPARHEQFLLIITAYASLRSMIDFVQTLKALRVHIQPNEFLARFLRAA
jgi:phosphatidylglycerophosphate synthase